MYRWQPFKPDAKKVEYIKLCLAIFTLAVFLCSCSATGVYQELSIPESAIVAEITDNTPQTPSATPLTATPEPPQASDTSPPVIPDGILQVFVFDVGQADCILVKNREHAMLIDAGDTGQGNLIIGYLSEADVTKLDYLVATHPHADHIGSMAHIVRTMDSIGSLLMPDVVHTTKTFEDLIGAIEEKDVAINIPEPGEMFEMGNAHIQVLAPNSTGYTGFNNYSIVLRIEYGQTSFLFTGDAEDISETEQLAKDYYLHADVLKIGHHGSHSSSSEKYLNAVLPSYAVISCGKGNSYGHPHDETMTRLSSMGVTVYRTDENGTVVFSSDGDNITVSVGRVAGAENTIPPASDNTETNAEQYIGNKNSKIFHKPTCSTLPAEKNRVYFSNRDEATTGQYKACRRCNP